MIETWLMEFPVVRFLLFPLLFALLLAGIGTASSHPRVLVLGDSLLASNRSEGGSVAQVLQERHGAEVLDRSTPGAGYFFGLPLFSWETIPNQFHGGDWDYVVISGGGNDLLFGCGCGECQELMDRLVSSDGRSGSIPTLVSELRARGARVIYIGYLRTPGLISPVESCGPLGDELDRRLTRMAAHDVGVDFLNLADLMRADGDRSFHAIDLVHPSAKGSAAIAERVAELMGH